jgi:predicted transcriptional regulator
MRTRQFGELELSILKIVQDLGRASVAKVYERLGKTGSYTTIMTVMGRLADKGELIREKEGRQYIYQSAANPSSHTLLKRLRDKLFSGKKTAMVCYLLEEEPLSNSELEEIESWIRKHKEERREK